MNRELFSAKEALALLGTQVSAFEPDASLPIGSRGRVVRIRKDDGASGFRILVRWEAVNGVQDGEFSKAEFKRLLKVSPGAP